MDKYYYFVSQLPALIFDQKPQVSRDYFLSQASQWLGEGEFKHFESISLNNFMMVSGEPKALTAYKQFELNLRRELTLFRQAKQQGGSYQSSGFNLVVDNSSPLEAERKLLLLRWNFIQEQESGHHFDLTWLILYFLKLQILERLFSFDKDKGLVLFDQLSVARI